MNPMVESVKHHRKKQTKVGWSKQSLLMIPKKESKKHRFIEPWQGFNHMFFDVSLKPQYL